MPQRTIQKKPVQVQAWTLNFQDYDDACELVAWCGGSPTGDGILIHTLEGDMLCRDGDTVVRGVSGEFYPVAREIVPLTYDEVAA